MKKVKKVMYAMTIIFALTLCARSFAQNPIILWSKTYGGPNQDYTQNSVKTSDGGSILAGLQDDSVYNRNILVIKSDNLGNIQWQKTFGGSHFDDAYSIIQTIDGGYIFTGTTYSTDGDVVGNTDSLQGNVWVVKINPSGIIVWQKVFGGSGYEGLNIIRQANDGSYFISGSTNSNDGDMTSNHGQVDIFVIKISSVGTLLWSKCYGGTNEELGNKCIITSSGGLLVTGYTYSSDGDIPSNNGMMDGWAFEVNSSGTIVWSKAFGGSGYDNLNSAIETPTSYLLVGHKGINGDDAWVIVVDKLGVFLSEKFYGGSNSEVFFDIVSTGQGGYVLSGATMSDDGDVSGNHNTPGTYWDAWVVVLDASLVIKSQRCLGGSESEMLFSIIKIGNDYLLTGNTYSSDGDVVGYQGNGDIWVVKLSIVSPLAIKDVHFNATLQGNSVKTIWNVQSEYSSYKVERSKDAINWQVINTTITNRYTDENPYTGISYYRVKAYKHDGSFEYSDIVKINYRTDVTKIRPTITHDVVIVSGTSPGSRIELYSMDGGLLFSKIISGNIETIDLSRFASGFYLLRVGGFTQKIIKM